MQRKSLAVVAAFLAFLINDGFAADQRARNLILFLGDAGGLSTLNAASLYAYNEPQRLFIQHMPYIGLSDTSSLDRWVTDSAAGMTAIVTGHKTNNGMLSLLPGATGAAPAPLKTILEYAEEKGLATGVVTNMPVWDATPAACYAHAASRKSTVEIFSQVFAPRFGNGVDVLIGADRRNLFEAMSAGGTNVETALQKSGYAWFDAPAKITADVSRAVSVYDGGDFEPQPVIDNVVRILSRSPRGFFLMIEWDMHTNHLLRGLDRAIVMDNLIRHVADQVSEDTLLIYAADHSFDIRLDGGKRDTPMRDQIIASAAMPPPVSPAIRVNDSHSGEEIIVAAQGPGAEQVRGFMPNTQIFHVMMSALGLQESQ